MLELVAAPRECVLFPLGARGLRGRGRRDCRFVVRPRRCAADGGQGCEDREEDETWAAAQGTEPPPQPVAHLVGGQEQASQQDEESQPDQAGATPPRGFGSFHDQPTKPSTSDTLSGNARLRSIAADQAAIAVF